MNVNRLCCNAMTGWLTHRFALIGYKGFIELRSGRKTLLQGNGKVRKRAKPSPSEVIKWLLVLSVFVFIPSAVCGPQEMTMGRRPTIQTTVTVLLTKSSLEACNQMLPVRFASKFVFCDYKYVKWSPTWAVYCPFILVEHHITTYTPPLSSPIFTNSSIISLSLLSSDAVVASHCWADQFEHQPWSQSVCAPLLVRSYLKVLSLQSCCTGGCLDSSTTQALPAHPPPPRAVLLH